jgi:hypothetical protein
VQEHQAKSLHWHFRLERGGVAPSWAVPKGVRGDCDLEKWEDGKIVFELHGKRLHGATH